MAEVGVEQHLDGTLAGRQNPGVQGLEQGQIAVFLVEHQIRFVDLDPFGAQLSELGDDLGVHGCDGIDQTLVVFKLLGLRIAGQLKEGVRADEHRLGGDAQLLGLVELVERLGAVELDLGGLIDFGDQVVVVGGEPFLHRQCGHIALVALVSTTHREQGLLRIIEGETLVTLRNHVQQDRGVEHLIVVAEIVARDQPAACCSFQCLARSSLAVARTSSRLALLFQYASMIFLSSRF